MSEGPVRALPHFHGAVSVGVADLRFRLPEILRRVAAGEWFAIVDMRKAGKDGTRGAEIARLGPAPLALELAAQATDPDGEDAVVVMFPGGRKTRGAGFARGGTIQVAREVNGAGDAVIRNLGGGGLYDSPRARDLTRRYGRKLLGKLAGDAGRIVDAAKRSDV